MRVASLLSSSGSRTVFGQYLRQVKSDQRNGNAVVDDVRTSFDSTTRAIDDLKGKLSILARQAERLKETDGFRKISFRERLLGNDVTGQDPVSTDTSGDGTTPPPPAPQGELSVRVASSDREKKFELELQKALYGGYNSSGDRLLKNKNLSGEIRVSNGTDSFTIAVDGDTTVQDFVDAVNAQGGGTIQASTVDRNGKQRIALRLAVAEEEQPVEPEAPPPPPSSSEGELLSGEERVVEGYSSEDVGALIQQLKRFATTYNDLVGYVRKNGSDASLSDTNVDESLVSIFRDVFKDSSGDQGRISFDDFASFSSSGRITLNEDRLKEAFFEDPNAVIDVFSSLARNVAGRQGVVKDYTAKGGVLDQAVYTIAQNQLAKLAEAEDSLSQEQEKKSSSLQNVSLKA